MPCGILFVPTLMWLRDTSCPTFTPERASEMAQRCIGLTQCFRIYMENKKESPPRDSSFRDKYVHKYNATQSIGVVSVTLLMVGCKICRHQEGYRCNNCTFPLIRKASQAFLNRRWKYSPTTTRHREAPFGRSVQNLFLLVIGRYLRVIVLLILTSFFSLGNSWLL